jgi:hypothetical protein
MMLQGIAAKQEMLMQQGGLNNPLAGVPEYRATLSRMLETINISDVSSYFKPLPPGWQPPPNPPPAPDPSLILAQVQQVKTSADLENTRAEAQTKRAQLLTDDDRERSQAALNYWTSAYNTAAQHGTPLPANVPPPSSPAQPATAAPQKPPQAPAPPGPMQGAPVRQLPPMMPPAPGMTPPAPAGPDPARQAVAQGLATGRMPTAYGGISNAAMNSALYGPGGPSLPRPGGQGVIAPQGMR